MTVNRIALAATTVLLGAVGAAAGEGTIDFDSERWVVFSGQVTEYQGRKCLAGSAFLKDAEFQDGVIEVDLLVTDVNKKSYPGINFRVQSQADYERFYIRPHRAPIYPDALQYTPAVKGIAGWQLYSGAGFTAAGEIPENEWIHVRLDVLGTQARVFVGDADSPALVIHELKHGVSKGTLSLIGFSDGTTYFADFSYKADDTLEFPHAPAADVVPGVIRDWEISQSFKISQIDPARHPSDQSLPEIQWRPVTGEPSGLVDIARHIGRYSREPDCVIAKTTIESESGQVKKYAFGYSDWIGIFLNGEMLFSANSSYQSRDPSFLGIVGLNDVLYLPLREGANELLLVIAEGFGGWGFMWQDAEAIYRHAGVVKAWETDEDFTVPESIAWDPEANAIYVSNYDAYNPSGNEGRQFISKMSPEGAALELEWVGGLSNPTGMAALDGRLFVVERSGVVEIDTRNAGIIERHALPEPGFPNDIAIDGNGNIYVSDSRKSVIYRSTGAAFEEWLKGDDIDNPNGLLTLGDKLYIGNNGDTSLKVADLVDGGVSVVAKFRDGIIDGICRDGADNLIVSHWEGRVYRISPAGDVVKILDTTAPGSNCADIEYVVGEDLLLVPTYLDNSVHAYHISTN
jgi:sugar lactone lactonase YvrE